MFGVKLVGLVTCIKLVVIFLSFCAFNALPQFDLSPLALDRHDSAWLRWDALHYDNLAQRGYTFEHELAFSPGIQIVYHLAAGSAARAHVIGWIAAVASSLSFYSVSRDMLGDTKHARKAAVLYCFSPHLVVSHSTLYTEPFAAHFTFFGLHLFLSLAQSSSMVAAVAFSAAAWAIATAFRPLALLTPLVVYASVAFQALFGSSKRASKISTIALAAVGTAFAAMPFVAFQAWASNRMCRDSRRPWCSETIPISFSYGFIQSHYWNVGLFKYWRPSQIPNFVLAAPVITVSIMASYAYYTHNRANMFQRSFPFLKLEPPSPARNDEDEQLRTASFYGQQMTALVHLHTLTTVLMLTTAHVQIMLRTIATNPVPFWYLADAASRKRQVVWIKYCAWWCPVAVILWTLFYPPA